MILAQLHMKSYYLNESYLLKKEPPTPNSNQLVPVYSMSTNPEPVPGPGTESAGWWWRLAGSLAGNSRSGGDTGFQKEQ